MSHAIVQVATSLFLFTSSPLGTVWALGNDQSQSLLKALIRAKMLLLSGATWTAVGSRQWTVPTLEKIAYIEGCRTREGRRT
jgi:hypothetical protein